MQEIISLFQSINPFDDVEREHIEDALDWIRSGVNIFRIKKPATPPKHLVCYTVLCDPRATKLLLLEHRGAGLLLPSGGHVEKDEMPYNTAKRELREELGIEPDFILESPFFFSKVETVGKTSESHIDMDLWYLLRANSKEHGIDTKNDEFQREFGDFNWYSFDEILNMSLNGLDSNMHRFINKLQKHIYGNRFQL